MHFLVFLALAVASVLAQQQGQYLTVPKEPHYVKGIQGVEEQPRDKRTVLLQTYPATVHNRLLYRDVLPTTYDSYYPYTYPYTYYSSYYPYAYYK